jgi:hypothetical protein
MRTHKMTFPDASLPQTFVSIEKVVQFTPAYSQITTTNSGEPIVLAECGQVNISIVFAHLNGLEVERVEVFDLFTQFTKPGCTQIRMTQQVC